MTSQAKCAGGFWARSRRDTHAISRNHNIPIEKERPLEQGGARDFLAILGGAPLLSAAAFFPRPSFVPFFA